MIYLISGSPQAGKSTLGKKLANKLNIPCLSTDTLIPKVRSKFKGADKEKLFPFYNMFYTRTIDEFFLKYSCKEILQADFQEAHSIWPHLQQAIEDKHNLVIEGVHILPALLCHLKTNNYRLIILNKSCKEDIYQGLVKNKFHNDWLMDNIESEEACKKAVELLCYYGKYFEKEAQGKNIKLINTEKAFHKQLDLALDYLIQ